MRREIERLRGELEKKEPAVSRQPQSVDKLTDERRGEILEAVEKALRDEDLICDPDFSINALAEATGVNSRYLSHIRNYGNLTIQAIAESVGYRSQSGFVQLFKKATGFTPSMFQKMAKEDN